MNYIVALCIGGIMEDPDFHYSQYQLIRADSEKSARERYNILNNASYFYGCCLGFVVKDLLFLKKEAFITIKNNSSNEELKEALRFFQNISVDTSTDIYNFFCEGEIICFTKKRLCDIICKVLAENTRF